MKNGIALKNKKFFFDVAPFYINQTYIYRIHISCEENPKADKNKCHNKTVE